MDREGKRQLLCLRSGRATLTDADTGRITIYYGAADTVTGMAFTTVDELLSYMRKYPHEV